MHGQLYDVTRLPALVAVAEGAIVRVLSYVIERDELEVVSCDAQPPGHGNGRALVNAVIDLARARGVRRVWCTTINDNLPALGFWQAIGFRLAALRIGAVQSARQLKPSIPDYGYRGLAVRDELDLETLV